MNSIFGSSTDPDTTQAEAYVDYESETDHSTADSTNDTHTPEPNELRLALEAAYEDGDLELVEHYANELYDLVGEDAIDITMQTINAAIDEGQSTWFTRENIVGGAWDRRWQIATGVSVTGCALAALVSGGVALAACATRTGIMLAAAKEAEVTIREAGADDGFDVSRWAKNSLFNGLTTALGSLPGMGVPFTAGCAASLWCSGPYWDDPTENGDEGFWD